MHRDGRKGNIESEVLQSIQDSIRVGFCITCLGTIIDRELLNKICMDYSHSIVSIDNVYWKLY